MDDHPAADDAALDARVDPRPQQQASGNPRRLLRIGEVVMTLVLIAIVGLIFMPPFHGDAVRRANQQACAKNQNQIITACIAYSGDFNAPWPIGVSAAATFPVSTPDQARLVTARSFEVLAATMSLPNGLFKCTSTAQPGPSTKPGMGTTTDSWGGMAGGRPSYAFDWAAPADPSAIRVMTADLTPANHKGELVMVAYGDGHVRALKVAKSKQPSGHLTVAPDGRPATWVIENPDAVDTDNPQQAPPDNIFDAAGDGGLDEQGRPFDPLRVGGASPRRAWVK